MDSWKQIVLSCPFQYVILESDDDIWRAGRQIRYNLAQDSAAMKLTALQDSAGGGGGATPWAVTKRW
eukprot:6312115-Pyramimonas_sp.AAC.1